MRNKQLIDALNPDTKGLSNKTIKSTYFTMASSLTRMAMMLITTPILARILTPEDYGIVGLSMIVTEIIVLFSEVGLVAYIIQKAKLTISEIETGFWLNFLVGIVLAGLIALASPLAAYFFDVEELTEILLFSALAFFIINSTAIHHALLMRTLSYGTIAFIEISSILIRYSIAIYMAYSGYGFWALVISALIGFGVTSLLRILLFRWIPRFRFNINTGKTIFEKGKHVFLDNLMNYASNNVDNIIIGKRLGVESLGLYQMAFSIQSMLKQIFSQILNRVLFSSYSKVQNEKTRRNNAFIKITEALAFLSFPAFGSLIFLAEDVVLLFLGEKWINSILPLQLISISALMMPVASNCSSMLYGIGRMDLNKNLTAARLILNVFGVFTGSFFGLNGIALMLSISLLVWVSLQIHFTCKELELPMLRFMKALLPAGLTTLATVSILEAISVSNQSWISGLNNFQDFLLFLPLGALIYTAILMIFWRKKIFTYTGYLKRKPG